MPSDLRARHMAQYPNGPVDERRAQPPGESAAQAPALLASKTAVPDLPTVVVQRPRLFELLSAGVRRPLTLLSAPAGFGKTVLLASWVAAGQPPGHVAWVSLDPDDNDAGRLWSYVLAAVDRCGAVPDETTLETVPPPAPGAQDLQLAPLVNGLAELETPVILVLDDFHEISDPAVLRGVQFLLRHAPPQLRLLIASRADPQLPLPRLRTGGLLAELRAAELAFTPAEAAELLAAEGLALSGDELERLHAHAEGWAAGLRLAALTLQRDPDPGRLIAQFAGDDRGVADYFIGEVLDRQAPEVRALLLRSAILSRMTGPLVDALTGRHDGERVLAEMERTNAFVISLDQRSWYRYHQLFAELLRVELRHQAPEEVPALHRRAAGWYAANGFALEAVRHAMAAGDWRFATAVLLEHWNDLVHDDPTVLRELLALLPPELAQEDPELALASAADRAEAALPSADPLADGSRGSLPLLLAAFQLGEAWQANDVEGVSVAALKMLALLGDAGAEPREDDEARVLALCALGAAERCSGELEAAGASLERGLGIARRAGLERSRLDCMSHLALLEGVRGRLRAAFRAAQAALGLAEEHGWSSTPQAAGAHLALTMVHCHWNELSAAKDHLDRVIQISGNGSSPVYPVLMDGVSVVHAWLSMVQGDVAGAQALLARTRQRLSGCHPPAFVDRTVTVMEAGAHAAAGDLQAAKALLERADDSPPRTGEIAVTLAGLELAEGEPAAAAATLAPCLNGSASTLSFARLTYAYLLGALAAYALGDGDHAFRLLERALVLADQEGFRLQFSTVGSGVRPLLAAQLKHDTAHRTLVLELLEALEPAPAPAPRDPSPEQVVLIEPLSERERIVLRYLGGVLSNVEIASELYVSVNTVKTHVKSIYRKLEVTGRREAIRKARELHLL